MKKLSGADWVREFPGSSSTADLSMQFCPGVERFIKALKKAGASVNISATLRPPERAYLMHWAWMLSNKKVTPEKIPSYRGIPIEWNHQTNEKSVIAAKNMVNAYGMQRLHIAPALNSRHTEGNAIDMDISWSGILKIEDAKGEMVEIEKRPSNGMNVELHKVAKTYGVVKFSGGMGDAPHWSTDGR